MKAQVLKAITQKAIAEHMRTRPNKLYNDLVSKAESAAKDGSNYISYHFIDSEEIVDRVIHKLKEEGFTVSPHDDPYYVIIKW